MGCSTLVALALKAAIIHCFICIVYMTWYLKAKENANIDFY